jgi:hypothetical protein
VATPKPDSRLRSDSSGRTITNSPPRMTVMTHLKPRGRNSTTDREHARRYGPCLLGRPRRPLRFRLHLRCPPQPVGHVPKPRAADGNRGGETGD